MMVWKNYFLAKTVAEALRLLAEAPGPSLPVAGGTDLLLDLQQGRHSPVHTLVDITQIPEMKTLEIREGQLFIGAAVPLNQIVSSPLIHEHAQALYEAASLIGGPQVRNTATLGGNVAHALPAGDGTIALIALDARAEIAHLSGRRRTALPQLFSGPGQSTLRRGEELLVGFYLPIKDQQQGSAFRRIMRPQGVAIAILNMAAWIRREGEQIAEVRISLGPAGPTPRRALQAETTLRSRTLSQETMDMAIKALQDESKFRTSRHRATAPYRYRMADYLFREVLQSAYQRAALEGQVSFELR